VIHQSLLRCRRYESDRDNRIGPRTVKRALSTSPKPLKDKPKVKKAKKKAKKKPG